MIKTRPERSPSYCSQTYLDESTDSLEELEVALFLRFFSMSHEQLRTFGALIRPPLLWDSYIHDLSRPFRNRVVSRINRR
jgi:hypothetical protein